MNASSRLGRGQSGCEPVAPPRDTTAAPLLSDLTLRPRQGCGYPSGRVVVRLRTPARPRMSGAATQEGLGLNSSSVALKEASPFVRVLTAALQGQGHVVLLSPATSCASGTLRRRGCSVEGRHGDLVGSAV